MIKLILAATVLLVIAFAGIAIKLFFFPNAEFKKSCSSVNPNTGERMGCSCGGGDETSCENS